MTIETIDHRKMSEADARAIAELLVAIWPKVGRTVEARTDELLKRWKGYSGPGPQHPRSFIVRENGRIVAHASFDPRTIGTRRGDTTVLALARVCADPVARGRKLGQAVVQAAFDVVNSGAFPFALFQTGLDVQRFYEKLGAVRIHNSFVNSFGEDPRANPWWNPVIMRYPSGPGWPEGEIDLRGPGW